MPRPHAGAPSTSIASRHIRTSGAASTVARSQARRGSTTRPTSRDGADAKRPTSREDRAISRPISREADA
eukprot:2979621-Prymnesium_polylepis.1